ncbi:MogA/MoaB family molybdenum cofactor biosynthesis protein [Natrarchaeobius oligotrophus]|uniref:Molybdenum cofactor biosynthesis protein n=1 Tax=Natrarchaeobius chitinivorans TaxID=1679083 RepID=A0A3N6MGZ5_NATCH|nr:molybdopterin-binding protein [Natrarchaeobius chitinivorans]RQH00305.1 molybdenum cofactor biosynthesis protein [Natrarchaeobius chitinivorans]
MNETESDPKSSATDPDAASSPLGAGVVTIASTRTLESDAAGEAIGTAIERAGHDLATREHVGPDHDRVQAIVLRIIERKDVDVVVTAGAAGVEPSDVAIEAIEPLLEKELSSFRELFTTLAYQEVGTRVVAARTLAGVAQGTLVFCLPGNVDAARLGIEEIIVPEAAHLVELVRTDGTASDGDETDSAAETVSTDDDR